MQNGNITYKSDVEAEYAYDQMRINAVVKLTGAVQQDLQAQEITYTAFDRPARTEEGEQNTRWDYDGNHERRRMAHYNAAEAAFTRYYFDNYEVTIDHTRDDYRYETHYIGGGDGLAAVVRRDQQDDDQLHTYAI